MKPADYRADGVTEPGLTEAEMRDAEAPSPKAIDELSAYLTTLVDRPHDYGTCVYAMSLGAVATWQFLAGELGVTGFQASCSDLDIIKRTRRMKGPFMLIDGENALYPQYDLPKRLADAMYEWSGWLGAEAKKLLAEENAFTHPDVIAHWQQLVRRAEYLEAAARG